MKYATLKTRLSCIPRIRKQRGCKFEKECKLSATAVFAYKMHATCDKPIDTFY